MSQVFDKNNWRAQGKSLKINKSLNNREEFHEQELMNMLKTMKLSPDAKRKLTVIDQDQRAKEKLEQFIRNAF